MNTVGKLSKEDAYKMLDLVVADAMRSFLRQAIDKFQPIVKDDIGIVARIAAKRMSVVVAEINDEVEKANSHDMKIVDLVE